MIRVFDIIFSSLGLVVLMPLLLPIMILLRLTGEGEIFFLQQRIGRQGHKFYLYKFATMLKDSPNIGTGTITVANDPRVLPLGKFLRKSKINELPQLYNVLVGNMSLIGPRPLTYENYSAYSNVTQSIISKVRPGLSGIGSIIFRDEEKLMQGKSASTEFYNERIAPYKGEVEQWFVGKLGIILYFQLIFITVHCVLFPRSKLVWKFYPSLSKPPTDLSKLLQ
jgi:lipopolysaccharide/colanic/teichoic acid biosynthesis glycosyltransferase